MGRFVNYYNDLPLEIIYYFNILGVIPDFIIPYIETDELYRLKDISYFCGMDYCSKKMYNFKYYVSRLDHSISTAIITYHLTNDKTLTIQALLHDIATPTFSHVVDYMQDDLMNQETTEKGYLDYINCDSLFELFAKDGIDFKDLLSLNKNSIVDNNTPRLCADRLDGLFLNNLVWSRQLTLEEIAYIYNHIIVVNNEDNYQEIAFNDVNIAKRVNDLSIIIGKMQSEKEDMFPMLLMAEILKYLIVKEYLSYDDLYNMEEKGIINLIGYYMVDDLELETMYYAFIAMESVQSVKSCKVKKRYIDPLVNKTRITKIDSNCYNNTRRYLES